MTFCKNNYCANFVIPEIEWCQTCTNNGANLKCQLCSVEPQYKDYYCKNCYFSCEYCVQLLNENYKFCDNCGKLNNKYCQ